MPTIKDVAREAGVAHGTVSNALSGRGHVSLEKIQRVREAAVRLGYTYNERAATLRSGQKTGLAVLLPDVSCAAYADFYAGFCDAASEEGAHTVQLYVTGNVPRAELHALRAACNARVYGVAAVSSIAEDGGERFLSQAGDARVLFVERWLAGDAPYLGFDFARAGDALARLAIEGGARRAGVMTNLLCYPCERAFYEAASARFAEAGVPVTHVQAISRQYATRAFDFCAAGVDAVVASCREMADSVRGAWDICGSGGAPSLYAVSPSRTLPPGGMTVYEMNYRLLGREAYGHLAHNEAARAPKGAGVRAAASAPRAAWGDVRLLTQESPFTNALRLLAPSLLRETGVRLVLSTFPRNELFDAIEALGGTDAYDLIRMDMSWTDWYAPRFFMPLDELDLDVPALLSTFVEGMDGEYTCVDGVRRVLPLEPSALLLHYRRDLFGDADIRRSFYEATRTELRVPETYDEYNRVAAFFTRAVNPASRTLFGSTITHTASEFIPYLLCALRQEKLTRFDTPACLRELTCYLESQKYAHLSVTGRWLDTADEFIAGNCAMTVLYTNYAERIVTNPVSHVAGRVGLAKLPGARAFLGGGVLGVPAASGRHDAACAFLRWVYREDTAQQLALLSGCSASRVAYENPEVRALYPWLPDVGRSFLGGVRRGVFDTAGRPFNVKAFEGCIGIACRNAASGVMTPEQAVAYIQRVYDDMRSARST